MNMGEVNDKLSLLRMTYGKNVLYTDGLYHIMDDKHREFYINSETGEVDKRGKYVTMAVYANTVVARVINDIKIRTVVLNKNNLRCMYKTTGNIILVDKNIMFDNKGILLSTSGKELMCLDRIANVENIISNYYVVTCSSMFNDKLIQYIEQMDKIKDLTKNKRYTINKLDENSKKVEILNMLGSRHTYDFSEHNYFNDFTLEMEGDTQLWTLN